MENQQYYQPLSHALNPPLVPSVRSPQPLYAPYSSHPHHQQHVTNGAPTAPQQANTLTHNHREEEEEEEEDDEEVVEEELDPNDHDAHQSPSAQSPPRQAQTRGTGCVSFFSLSVYTYRMSIHPAGRALTSLGTASPSLKHSTQGTDSKSTERRRPGRPPGSKNRKPRSATTSKAPANSQHPGFYQYPPAPSGTIPQNQQFYEFQWRALNLCSEFYNAAEELVVRSRPNSALC